MRTSFGPVLCSGIVFVTHGCCTSAKTCHSFQQVIIIPFICRDQLQIMYILAIYHYDKFGHYDKVFKSMYNEDVAKVFDAKEYQNVIVAIEEFKVELEEVSAAIDEANAKRQVKYEYLKPENIINSISV